MKALVALTALAAMLLAALAWHDAPAPQRPAAGEADATSAAAAAQAGRPPIADAAAQRLFRQLGTQAPAPPAPELSLADNQELIADFALHALMDSFLLNRRDASRMQALIDHLRRTLPANAAAEAIQIATRYQAYLVVHDELLAAQNFTSEDVASLDLNRLSSWQQQRQQLRVRMLGERIALEWFGNEETYAVQALDEWRQRGSGQAPPSAANQDDQARHDQHMRQALNQLAAKAN
ncbi:hypothetical protein [Duganella sp. Dugasp56]|uniref:hypothetical protein n=1 Tax=Duganella sp. Dugasp56 TaxID=3243046 RepID=UPI0039B11E90